MKFLLTLFVLNINQDMLEDKEWHQQHLFGSQSWAHLFLQKQVKNIKLFYLFIFV